MKTSVTKGYYLLSVIILFLFAALPASAQYSGTDLETGGLYTALAKDVNNNLYVTRVEAGTSGGIYEVEKYTNGAGTPAFVYGGLTHQIGDYPWGLAVDGSGNIYISTDFTSGGGSITKLTNNGGAYTASTFQTGRYFSALAIDAGNNLYTAEYDATNKTYAVVKYAAGSASGAAGTNLYDNLKSGAGYAYPTGLVVASNGDIYVADAFSNIPSITDGGHVYKLTAASSYSVSTVSTGNYASSLALDASGNLYSSENRGSGYSLIEYAGATGTGTPIFPSLHSNGIYYPWGIIVYSSTAIIVADGDDGINGGAVIHLYLTPPTVTTDPATSITVSAATLNGLVNDNGNATTVNFIYGTSPTLTGATTKAATTGGSIKAGTGNTAVALSITGLSPSTSYYFAVSATNVGGTIQGPILNLVTAPTISYSGPNNYLVYSTITPLTPKHTTVAAAAYGSAVAVGSGFSTPFGVAADAAGNIYVADYGAGELKKIPAGGGTPIVLASGYTSIIGVAVDLSGNVYTSDISTDLVQKISGGGTGIPITIGSGFNEPYGLAVDLAGNVYVADLGNNAVKEIPVGNGAPFVLGSGFGQPTAVAVDAAGNVYVADYGTESVKEILLNVTTPITLGSGFNSPFGVAVDPSGNVFVADYGASAIDELPFGGGPTIVIGSGFTNPTSVIVDGLGKVDVADYGNHLVKQVVPVGGFYLSPALPAGLTINASTGVISGKPTAITPATNYTVTAYEPDGGTSATVNIKTLANAELVSLALSSGTLSPVFAPATISYSASVSSSTTTISVTPTAIAPGSTITVNGFSNPSGTVSDGIPLNIGANTILIVVTASDGTTKLTYTLTVTRASNIATLSNLTTSSGTLTPAFASGTTSYTDVAHSVSSIAFRATTTDPAATETINGTVVPEGTVSYYVPLNAGVNTITIVVTAQDGVTTDTYTVAVTRLPEVATLSKLTVSSGTLTPAFATGTTSYTDVAHSVSSIAFRATTTDPLATETINGTAVPEGTVSPYIPLNTGVNNISVVVTAQDGVTQDTYTIAVTRLPEIATLSGLTISSGTLTPAFATATTSYTDNVANTVASIAFRATTTDALATETINGTAVSEGTVSPYIPLNIGSNTITIVVTAQDGVTQDTYTIAVTRTPGIATLSGLTISSGTLSPAFATGTTSYADKVANSVSSIAFRATTTDPLATETINGTAVPEGTVSPYIPLNVGLNTITIVVTAQDGITQDTYTVTVTRASNVATLSGLTISSGTLTPAFASGTTSYTDVAHSVSSIAFRATTTDPLATETINGTAVPEGTVSPFIPLNVGSNTITIVVTAQDGVTKDTYTTAVTRLPEIATLSGLTISSGTLTPAFATATTSYTDNVVNTVTSVAFRATTTDPLATETINGTAVPEGTVSPYFPLNVGPNTITIIITAQDGVTTETYSIAVTRAASSVADAVYQPVSVETTTETPQLEEDVVIVHQGVSPNGDGVDDFLQIDGILAFPDNRLMIMNRNGTLVYEIKGYDNSTRIFDGHSNKNGQMQLPGTYFYQLNYVVNGITKHKTGFLVLKY
jgi:gliding motility-associated-like protein